MSAIQIMSTIAAVLLVTAIYTLLSIYHYVKTIFENFVQPPLKRKSQDFVHDS